MIGKISKGCGFGGVLSYLLDPAKQPRIISNCMFGTQVDELAREFRSISNQNPRTTKPVRHFSIAFAPEDGSVDDVIKEAIALRVLDGLGYAQCQYLAIDHHRDDPGHDEAHDHDHLHVLTNAVDVFGKHVDDGWDMYRIQDILRAAEADFGLRQVESSWDVKRAKVQAREARIANLDLEIVNTLADSLQTRTNLEQWLNGLAQQKIDVRFNLTSRGVVRGITFIQDGQVYKGSDIGASWQKVNDILIPSDRDLTLMQTANLRAQDRPAKLNLENRELFDRVAELAAIKLGERKKFENGRIKIKSDGDNLTVFRIRPNKLMLTASRSEGGWEPVGFPDLDLRDMKLLERLNGIEAKTHVLDLSTKATSEAPRINSKKLDCEILTDNREAESPLESKLGSLESLEVENIDWYEEEEELAWNDLSI
jgi:Relaxase/Mobilisation nuclease domain